MLFNANSIDFSVGATIGRPLHLPEFHADNQQFSIQKTNIKFMVNHNSAGDQWSPLQKQYSYYLI